MDGGYAEYMVAYVDSLSSIPNEISVMEAASLMCAGKTTFSAIKNCKARPGDLVAIQGIGGLGHLAVQFESKAGFLTLAISRGNNKEALARELGAHHYIDSAEEDPSEALQGLDGNKVYLATAPNAKAVSSLINGLGQDGELIIVTTSSYSLELSAMDFMKGPGTVKGTLTGGAEEIQATINFSVLTDTRPMIESYPLDRASEAYDKMKSPSLISVLY
ncbi:MULTISPECIES: zinc-binding dehydrogenase [unclassified Paenibacillus]|nr:MULTISPECIES: zinc-binding dehydrogenase [unclassified Paenibacillus]